MTILLADDHGLFRESIKQWLEMLHDDRPIVTAASHAEVTTLLQRDSLPSLLMLDLCMPGMRGLESVREIHETWPDLPILVVSANDDPLVMRGCLDAGASGFLPKSGNGKTMQEAIHLVLNGGTYFPHEAINRHLPRLSQKQLKILYLLAEGCSNRDIADKAFLTEGTVKQYVSEILSKLGVDNRVQAALRAREILGLNK